MSTKCYQYAYQYLSRYPKTSYELKKVLTKKGYTQQEAEENSKIY